MDTDALIAAYSKLKEDGKAHSEEGVSLRKALFERAISLCRRAQFLLDEMRKKHEAKVAEMGTETI
jgi:hypothetical protein